MTFEDMDMSGHFTWTERADLSPIQRAPYREVVLTDHGNLTSLGEATLPLGLRLTGQG